MTEIHNVKCDGCGVIAKMKDGCYGYYHTPKSWGYSFDINSDYCHSCYKKYKKCLKKCKRGVAE